MSDASWLAFAPPIRLHRLPHPRGDERQLLLEPPFLRSLLLGHKTQLRYPIRPAPPKGMQRETVGLDTSVSDIWVGSTFLGEPWRARCRFGEQGRTRLTVQEAAFVRPVGADEASTHVDPKGHPFLVRYAIDLTKQELGAYVTEWARRGLAITPASKLPRWACRRLLLLRDVSVVRLHDMNLDDARAEGIPQMVGEAVRLGYWTMTKGSQDGTGPDARDLWDNRTSLENFQVIWNERFGPENWDTNPWVWRLGLEDVTEETR